MSFPTTSPKILAAYYDRFDLWPHEAAGLRQVRRSRQTGTLISVYDGEAALMDTDGGRWQTVCEDHSMICSHPTLALALDHAGYPQGWCEDCEAAMSAKVEA
jgi:hypothetical protein